MHIIGEIWDRIIIQHIWLIEEAIRMVIILLFFIIIAILKMMFIKIRNIHVFDIFRFINIFMGMIFWMVMRKKILFLLLISMIIEENQLVNGWSPILNIATNLNINIEYLFSIWLFRGFDIYNISIIIINMIDGIDCVIR